MLYKSEPPAKNRVPTGLTEKEAAERLARFGENALADKKRGGFIKKLLFSFADVMTLVLFAAAAVSFAVAKLKGESAADSYIILAIVFLNGIISAAQEIKAEKALDALKSLSSPLCTVIRGGEKTRVPSRTVVPGDLICVEKGDYIPADAKIIINRALRTDESALTGESGAVEKREERTSGTHPAEMHDTLWAGTVAVEGGAVAEVISTGMNTRMGGIAGMLMTEESPQTPLQKRLARISTRLGNAALAICLVIFGISVWRGAAPADAFLDSVSLAVAAIPEGLPAVVTVMLSMGVTEMARRGAVVKKLPAVETLGCATVICTDKTGTLTENRLTVTETRGDRIRLARAFALCGRHASPTENALYRFAQGVEGADITTGAEILRELPFDHERRLMVTLHRENGRYAAYMKGAPEEVSSYARSADMRSVAAMASRGLRVIAAAEAVFDSPPNDLLKGDYRWIGCAGMTDPPRKEAKAAVESCRRAGIRTVMITGDHPDTAFSVARELGIAARKDEVKTQSQIESLPAEKQDEAILRAAVFARAAPEFKVKIIRSYKNAGGICAMTGDGVNDAPALKSAHIGCAMGKNGTDVAREACDMILTDDDYSTIAAAVKTGRGIYENIRRAVHFLISCNTGEIFAVFASLVLGMTSPVSAVQLLWVNLVTDSLPAVALGLGKAEDTLMEKPPLKPNSPLFCKAEIMLIALEGVAVGALTMLARIYGGAYAGGTMAFGVLSFTQLFHSFNVKSDRTIIRSGIDLPLAVSFIVSAAVQLAAMTLPALMKIFGTVPLNARQWIAVCALSAFMLAAGEISKAASRKARTVTKSIANRRKV